MKNSKCSIFNQLCSAGGLLRRLFELSERDRASIGAGISRQAHEIPKAVQARLSGVRDQNSGVKNRLPFFRFSLFDQQGQLLSSSPSHEKELDRFELALIGPFTGVKLQKQ